MYEVRVFKRKVYGNMCVYIKKSFEGFFLMIKDIL